MKIAEHITVVLIYQNSNSCTIVINSKTS